LKVRIVALWIERHVWSFICKAIGISLTKTTEERHNLIDEINRCSSSDYGKWDEKS